MTVRAKLLTLIAVVALQHQAFDNSAPVTRSSTATWGNSFDYTQHTNKVAVYNTADIIFIYLMHLYKIIVVGLFRSFHQIFYLQFDLLMLYLSVSESEIHFTSLIICFILNQKYFIKYFLLHPMPVIQLLFCQWLCCVLHT